VCRQAATSMSARPPARGRGPRRRWRSTASLSPSAERACLNVLVDGLAPIRAGSCLTAPLEVRAVGEPEHVPPRVTDRGEGPVREIKRLRFEFHVLRGELAVGGTDVVHPQDDA
jgi:hypothetical protein